MELNFFDTQGNDLTNAINTLNDREKVKALLLSLLEELDVPVDNLGFKVTDFYHDEDGILFVNNDGHNNPEWGDGPLHEAFTTGFIPTDKLVDRLIEGLAGKASS